MSAEQSFLSPKQRRKIAQAIVKKFNLPIVKDGKEVKAWSKLVKAIDRLIAERVQDEYLEAMNDGTFQVEDVVADALKDNLSGLLADLLAVPILPRSLKIKVIDFVLDLIVEAMAKATKLDELVEEFLQKQDVVREG